MKLRILIFTLIMAFSCSTKKKPKVQTVEKFKPSKIYFEILKPTSLDTLICDSKINFQIRLVDSVSSIDSFRLFFNGELIESQLRNEFSLTLSPKTVGENFLRIQAFRNDSLIQTKSINPFFISNIVPKELEFRLVNTYPHSMDYFTEGLVFDNGLLYEGTGDWGKSGVFVTNLETGEVLKSHHLPSDKFGEGISVLNGRITQLTYQAQEGYIYDQESLEKQRTFKYSFYTEGWGLTTDQVNYYMSNGSDKIFVLDSTYYSLIREIHICDNREPIDSLNELEYVNGLIYSNIWMNNKIAQIDSKTGKVLGYLDLSSLIPDKYINHRANVLNGIAYLPENGNLLVTGKRWDKLYEIELLDKN